MRQSDFKNAAQCANIFLHKRHDRRLIAPCTFVNITSKCIRSFDACYIDATVQTASVLSGPRGRPGSAFSDSSDESKTLSLKGELLDPKQVRKTTPIGCVETLGTTPETRQHHIVTEGAQAYHHAFSAPHQAPAYPRSAPDFSRS